MLSKIAKKANVSLSTASRILNKNHNSHNQTRDAVIQAAKECNYYENSFKACHPLSHITIFTTKKLIRDIQETETNLYKIETYSEFYNKIIQGVTERAKELNLKTQIVFYNDNHLLDSVRDHFIQNKKTDAAIFVGTEEEDLHCCTPLLNSESCKKPFIFVNTQFHDSQYSNITPDNFSVGLKAAEYLYSRGHRTLLHVTEADRLTLQRRVEGFRHFCEQKIGTFSSAENILYIRDDTPEDIKSALDNYLKSTPLPSAIFSSTDSIAIKIIQYFHAKNIYIPSQISLISADNQYFCELVSPRLTSIAIPNTQLGIESVNILCFQSLFTPPMGTRVTLPGSLIIRDSVTDYKKHD